MKTLKNSITKINQFIEKIIGNYINKTTGAYFPKQKNKSQDLSKKDDDDEPILFI